MGEMADDAEREAINQMADEDAFVGYNQPKAAKDARELVDHLLDERGIVLTVGSEPPANFDQHFRQDWAAEIERYVQARLASAREQGMKSATSSTRSGSSRRS
jgi:hypothetical protein